MKNKTGLALDALGWGAYALFPQASLGSAIAGATLGGLGMVGAAVDNNGPADAVASGSLAYAAKQGAIANTVLRGAGSAIGGRIGFWALTASTTYDLAKTGVAFNTCMNR